MIEKAIYRLPDILTITGLRRTTIYAEMAKGSFPSPVSLTASGRAIGWTRDAVDHWLKKRVTRGGGDTQGVA